MSALSPLKYISIGRCEGLSLRSNGVKAACGELAPIGREPLVEKLAKPVRSTRIVLVTGGAGYIGAHACKALSAAGFVPVT